MAPKYAVRSSSSSSKVTKPASSNQSTLSSFFGLQEKRRAPFSVLQKPRGTIKSDERDSEKVIDLTQDDLSKSQTEESIILQKISPATSQLNILKSDQFSKSFSNVEPDDNDQLTDDDSVNPVNLKSKRPIGSFVEENKENSLNYVRSNRLTTPITSSADSSSSTLLSSSQYFTENSSTTMSKMVSSKQTTIPWLSRQNSNSSSSSSSMMVNKSTLVKNPRMKATTVDQKRPSTRPSTEIHLSKEQETVLDLILDKKLNVFYTGSAGTGKSVLLKELIKRLHRKYGSQYVAVTASTGLAAVNLGGQTINRFAGIGIGKESAMTLVSRIKKSRAVQGWKKVKVLIIDEISMIDGNLFHKLNQIGKLIRNSDRPFGGIQVVITGDFYQLPPVPDRNAAERPIFCFQSPSWKEVVQRTVLLTKVFRQKGDTQLINMLNALRLGQLDETSTQQFQALQRPVRYDDGIEPTELFPLRHEVERANKIRLDRLQTYKKVFMARDSGAQQYISLLDNVIAVKELHLKEDAQVMYLKNKNDVIVNGSVGKVLYFVTPNLWQKISAILRHLDSTDTIQQVRLLTQCVGVKCFDPDLSAKVNAMGESSSRFSTLVEWATRESQSDLLPVVKFSSIDGSSAIEIVQYEEFTVGNKGSGSTVERYQLPLVLSWAMSIHKSQGQTLERVKVDLNKVFEKGQVYVALSRAVSKEALQIIGFNPSKIRCSDEVKAFYEKLEKLS